MIKNEFPSHSFLYYMLYAISTTMNNQEVESV